MIRESLKAPFLKALAQTELKSRAAELLAHAQECLHITYKPPRGKVPPGCSKIGGLPDLPRSLEWPKGIDNFNQPLGHAEFIAQLNLPDLPPIPNLPLPTTGHLWLFLPRPGFTSAPAAVLYYSGSEPLSPRPSPHPRHSQNPPPPHTARLTFTPGLSLPFSSRPFQRLFPDAEQQLENLPGVTPPALDNPTRIDGQIGGYSYQAEFDLRRDHALKELGRPDAIEEDPWATAEEFERLTHVLTDPYRSEESNVRLRDRLSTMKWILDNDAAISARTDSLQLLAMFRPSINLGFDLGAGMFLDFLIPKTELSHLNFTSIQACCPMLL